MTLHLRSISKHNICCHFQQPRLHEDVIMWVPNKIKYTLCLRCASYNVKTNDTFYGTYRAETHWAQSLSPASWWGYSEHTDSDLMWMRLVHRWEPWNCFQSFHIHVQQSTVDLITKASQCKSFTVQGGVFVVSVCSDYTNHKHLYQVARGTLWQHCSSPAS